MKKEITVDIFFNEPNIVAQAPVKLFYRPSLDSFPIETFLEKYTARFNQNGGAVFDGTKLIGSIGRFNDLVVDPDYRGHGIATELVYQMIVHNPDRLPERKAVRTPWGAKAYKAAWARYKAEQETPAPAPAPVPAPAPAPAPAQP